MTKLPMSANTKRGRILCEIGLQIASNPDIPYGGNRDMCVVVGSGSGEAFKPSLRISSGSAILAHAVAKGDIEAAFVNPSAMLTQAYRGVGLFHAPLPLRIIANYPSIDRFVIAVRKELGFSSLEDIKKARYPLRLSLREDPTHSTLPLIHELLAFHGMSLDDINAWGGSLHPIGGPGDPRRISGFHEGTLDAVFDEGISVWLDEALSHDMELIEIDDGAFDHLGRLGWRRVPLKHGRFSYLDQEMDCIDFSGWPLYTSPDLPDTVAYEICEALATRADDLPWEANTYDGIHQLGQETDATPMDVPLHPGAERWFRDKGILD